MATKLNKKPKSLKEQVKELSEQLVLAKETIIAFSDSYQGGKAGNLCWFKAVKLYKKCEDMDLIN